MRPEEWRAGMENEAASVEDRGWARETRRAARINRWWSEARAVLCWRRLIPLLLLGLMPLSVFTLKLLPPLPGSLFFPLQALTNLVTSHAFSGLLLLWVGRCVWLGHIPWLVAAVGALLSFPMFWIVVALLRWQTPGGPAVNELPWLLSGRSTLLWFALLWSFAWALSRLGPASARHSA